MILSILICSLQSRKAQLDSLLECLSRQMMPGVEVLTNIDNKEKTTGAKRNELVKRAQGKYVIFVDDDDAVPDYYISELLIAADTGADCFAINGKMTTDGKNEVKWRISRRYQNVTTVEEGVPIYLRKTNHITGVRRILALRAPFPDKSNAEDKGYSDQVVKLVKTEFTIDKPMYHYQFSSKNKEYK